MAQLKVAVTWRNGIRMSETDLMKNSLRAQLFSLQGLLAYLEDRGALEAKDYGYCQSKIAETVKHLRRLEKLAGGDGNRS